MGTRNEGGCTRSLQNPWRHCNSPTGFSLWSCRSTRGRGSRQWKHGKERPGLGPVCPSSLCFATTREFFFWKPRAVLCNIPAGAPGPFLYNPLSKVVFPHFTKEGTEALKSSETCLRSKYKQRVGVVSGGLQSLKPCTSTHFFSSLRGSCPWLFSFLIVTETHTESRLCHSLKRSL